jgi:hypothetical protein
MLYVILILILVGVGLYLVNLIPMDANIKKIINILVIVLAIIWILSILFGPISGWGPPTPYRHT